MYHLVAGPILLQIGAALQPDEFGVADRREDDADEGQRQPGLHCGPVKEDKLQAFANFVRDAVLRPSGDPRRPVIALLCAEGSRTVPPNAPANTNEAGATAANTDGTRTQ